MKIKAVRTYQTVYVTPKKKEDKHFYVDSPHYQNLRMQEERHGVLFTSYDNEGNIEMVTLVPFTNIASINYVLEKKSEKKDSKKKG
jgi:hypothetical protein